mgnify:CR=1 FL=1
MADAITRLLDSPEIAANSSDLAICGGACGGDFAVRRGLPRPRHARSNCTFRSTKTRSSQIRSILPAPIGTIAILAAKSKAHAAYRARRARAAPSNDDPYERNNLWMLERAARFGACEDDL